MRVVNVRVAVIGRRPTLDLSLLAPGRGNAATVADAKEAVTAVRPVWVGGRWEDAPCSIASHYLLTPVSTGRRCSSNPTRRRFSSRTSPPGSTGSAI